MPDRIEFLANVELKAAGSKPGAVRIMAYGGGTMNVPGWGEVVIDLAGLEIGDQIPLLADHDNSIASIAGHGSAREISGQLWVEGQLSEATESARQIRALAKEGLQLRASVGVEPLGTKHLAPDTKINVNGRTVDIPASGATLINPGRLREVSLTAIGCDPTTEVSIAAAQKKGSDNMTATTTTTTPDPVTAERERIKQIEATTTGAWGDQAQRVAELKAQAIDGEIDLPTLQAGLLSSLRASRPTPPSHASDVGGAPDTSEVLTASLCISAGMGEQAAGDMFDEKTLDAAMGRKHRGAGLQSIVRAALMTQGESPSTIGETQIRTALEASAGMTHVSASTGFSTLSVSGILSNTANKLMLAAYNQVPTTWRKICGVGSNKDFKTATRYRLISDGSFERVGDGGQLKHGSLSDQSFETSIDTHGKLLTVTRKQFINDDLGAFSANPMILGRDGAVSLEKAIFTTLVGNANNFFHADNKNLVATNPLNISGLTTAEKLFLDQTDPSGQPTLIEPSVLLVSNAQKAVARTIVRANTVNETVVATTGSRKAAPNANPHVDAFDVVASPWLSNETIPGYSETDWYLFADPSKGIAAVRASFLDGRQTPHIESASVDFSTLGVGMRAYFDYGVDQEDPRGAVKSSA